MAETHKLTADESVRLWLVTDKNGLYVDGTFGSVGGHNSLV